MERKLASIQRIANIKPIPNADAIEVATVLGWKCVVKKGDFSPGDLVVYIEYDSLLPEREEFEFMRPHKFRIKTVKLRKQISQGLCFPLSILPTDILGPSNTLSEGDDVSDLLGIVKYEPPLKGDPGVKKGNFPTFIKKTDETRIQAVPRLLERQAGRVLYVTEKLDGSSITIYVKDGKVGVCSRNMELKDVEGNKFWDTVKQYKLVEKLLAANKNVALQGELIGEGIQKNKYKLEGQEIRLFNAFGIDDYIRLDLSDLKSLAKYCGVETVPILEERFTLQHTVDELVEYSVGFSELCPGVQREGVVIRSNGETIDDELGDLSFKVINPKFLLKFE
jgi:RNA ligase (TIGR02306 family)